MTEYSNNFKVNNNTVFLNHKQFKVKKVVKYRIFKI